MDFLQPAYYKDYRAGDIQQIVCAVYILNDDDKRIGAAAHLYGVSHAATMIAKKRGNDLSKEIKEKEQARYRKLCEEFGM